MRYNEIKNIKYKPLKYRWLEKLKIKYSLLKDKILYKLGLIKWKS